MIRAPGTRRLGAALAVVACALACRGEPAPGTAGGPIRWETGRRAAVTGDGLHRVRVYRVSSAFLRPGANFVGYRKVLIAPVDIAHASRPAGSGRSRVPLSPTEVDRIRRIFEAALRAEFAESRFEVVDEPDADVLRVTAQIVDLMVNTPPETGRNRVYVSVVGEATAILDVADSRSGISLGRIVDRRRLTPTGSNVGLQRAGDSEWSSIRRTFRQWAQLLREGLEELTTVGPLSHPEGDDGGETP